jgi:hypothetical protein
VCVCVCACICCRQVLLHPGGHFVPQQAAHCDTIVAFMRQFLGQPPGSAVADACPATSPLRSLPPGFGGSDTSLAAAAAAAPSVRGPVVEEVEQPSSLTDAEAGEPCAASEEQLEELEALKVGGMCFRR